MRVSSRLYLLVGFAFALASPMLCAGTEAVVTHHATLRSDPSSQHRPILVLESGEDVEVLDVTPSYHEVTWKALQSLPYPVARRSLDQWTPQQIAEIKPYEGVPVSITGYLLAIKVEDRGSGESTNCHFVNPEEVDWHMPFTEHPGDGEDTAVVVETSPRVRKSHPKWTTANLAPWVNSHAQVRISGWTLLDPEHRAHLGKYRSTLWEVHPVTKIEVFNDGQWVDVDNLP